MVEIYYKIDDSDTSNKKCYYSNTRWIGYDLLDLPLDNSSFYNPAFNRNVIIVLYNDKFILPEDSRYLFYSSVNTTLNDTDKGDTSNVTDMHNMFCYCYFLTSLDFSSGDTSNVTNMEEMFCYCSDLASLNLSGGDTSNVTNMQGMFQDCRALTSLDLFSFNTSNVTSMAGMFYTCIKLKTIYVSDYFVTTKSDYSPSMFLDCTSLVGGAGTDYNTAIIADKRYARIDNPPTAPGYFTRGGRKKCTVGLLC